MKHTIGVLALQGAFAKHMEMLSSLGADTVEVREPEDLSGIEGLIIPGGESTTISKMLVRWELIEPIRSLMAGGMPVYGTCAGLILLADRLVEWNDLPRLGGLDVTVARNAYGRQIDSFEAELDIVVSGAPEFEGEPFDGVFIRAPRIVVESGGDGAKPSPGPGVEILCSFEDLPVLVRQGNILAGSFHPELTGDSRVHAWFVKEMVAGAAAGAERAG